MIGSITLIPRLAARSLRARPSAVAANAVVLALGTMIAVAFATLIDCAGSAGISRNDHSALITIGAVVGGWSALIVAFAIASTIGPAIARRRAELHLLQRLGLTGGQTGRLIVAETGLVAVVAALLAAAPGVGLGAVVLAVLRGGVVRGSVPFAPSLSTVALVIAGVVVAAIASAWFAVRRGAAGTDEARVRGQLSLSRRIVAGLCLFIAVNGSVMTIAMNNGSATQAMSTCGSASVVAAIGLALLGAPIIRRVAEAVGGPGLAAFLARRDAQRRPGGLAAILAPVVAFVAITAGTMYMVAVDHADRIHLANGVELLNYLVTGMICVFTAIMTSCAIRGAVEDRNRELGLLRLAGSTAAQACRSVLAAAAIVAGVGVVLGLLASLTTALPYAAVRPDGWRPFAAVLIDGGVSIAAVTLVLGVTYHATRRVTDRDPALAVAA